MDVSHEADCAQVVHKERGKEKGKSPHSPLKEKESQKEISAASVSALSRACVRTCAHETEAEAVGFQPKIKAEAVTRSVPIRRNVSIVVDADMILHGELSGGRRNDPVAVAMFALRIPATSGLSRNGIPYTNAGLLRWLLKQIGEENFRQVVYQQWRENAIDGEPRSHAAALMAKLYAVRDRMLKGGAA